MTTPAAIIEVVSRRMGVARPTVALQDRMLVISGHRRISGRGRAARSTPADAAALLLAVAATPISGPAIKETVLHYERYAGLVAEDMTGRLDAWTLKHLRELAPGHTLKDAITAIIDAIASGVEQACDLWEEAEPDKGSIQTDLSIVVQFEAPTPSATVTVTAEQTVARVLGPEPIRWEDPVLEDVVVAKFFSQLRYFPTMRTLKSYVEALPELESGGWERPDLEQSRRFSLATLKPVAMLFRENSIQAVKS